MRVRAPRPPGGRAGCGQQPFRRHLQSCTFLPTSQPNTSLNGQNGGAQAPIHYKHRPSRPAPLPLPAGKLLFFRLCEGNRFRNALRGVRQSEAFHPLSGEVCFVAFFLFIEKHTPASLLLFAHALSGGRLAARPKKLVRPAANGPLPPSAGLRQRHKASKPSGKLIPSET